MIQTAIKKVLIVGGGSSGWMTAAYLARTFKQQVDITLVESANIRTIGVGEATFSTLKLFFDYLGLKEADWMPHCSGSYKLAIKFANWTKKKGYFYHPFERYRKTSGFDAGKWWLKLKRHEAFDYACFSTPYLCDAMRSPRFLDGRVYDSKVDAYYSEQAAPPNTRISGHEVQYPYGYHFNASELAEYLQGYAIERGVTRILDDVVEVPLAVDGAIAGVQTQEHGLLQADLFVDCTGFRGLLINQALREPVISFNDSLLNDSAVAIQVPRDIERDGIRPYTTATAHSAGWSWNIPLYGRDGTGYVYCSKFIDKDEAEREFREFLGPAAANSAPNHIKMRIGRCVNSWVKNCVAIGLSSGFVEPLESTGIFFIQHNIEELVAHFPGPKGLDENVAASFNKSVGECIDGVREFLTIHYFASDRDDTPYWRATKEVKLPASLAERLRIWKSRLPTPRTIYPAYHGFEDYSWSVMLLGLNYRPASHPALMDMLDDGEAETMFRQIKAEAAQLTAELPTVYEYLTQMRKQSRPERDRASSSASKRRGAERRNRL
jgi:flavin-dependent dehydrogenase